MLLIFKNHKVRIKVATLLMILSACGAPKRNILFPGQDSAAGNPDSAEETTPPVISEPGPDPTILITTPSSDLSLNAGASQPISVSGECSEVSEVEVQINPETTTNVTCTSNAFSFEISLTSLAQGANMVTISNNDGSALDAFEIHYDSIAPNISLDSPEQINSLNSGSFAIAGSCDDSTATASINIESTEFITECDGNTWSLNNLDLSEKPDGYLQLNVSIQDPSGNSSADISDVLAKDTQAPALSIDPVETLHSANQSSIDISGSCSEDSSPVDLDFGELSFSTTCDSGGFQLENLDLSSAPDSASIEVTATQTDSFGNIGNATTNALKDSTAPTIAFATLSNANQSNASSYILQGSCNEDNASVSGNIQSIPFSATCSFGSWSTTGIDLSFLSDGSLSASATAIDSHGNTSTSISGNITKDTTTPLPQVQIISPESGYGNQGSATLRMSGISNGDSLTLFSNSSCSTSIENVLASGSSHDFNVTTAAAGTYSYYYEVIDSELNSSGCLGPTIFIEDLSAPSTPTSISISSPSDGSTSNDSTPVFSGNVTAGEAGSLVKAFRDSSCSLSLGDGIVSSNNTFVINANLATDGSHNGINEFYFQVTDQAGNASSCWKSALSYTLSGAGLATLPKIAMVGDDSDSYLISLADDNQITWIQKSDPNNPIDLGTIAAGTVLQIVDPDDPNNKVNQGDRVESTGPTYIVTQGYGTAPWASEAYSGRKFSTHMFRYGENAPRIYVTSMTQPAFVQIKQDQDADGSPETLAFANIAVGETHLFELTLLNNIPLQVISDADINVYYVADSGDNNYSRDARVLTPAATDIVGFSYFITAIENATTVNAWRNQSGASYNALLNVTDSLNTGRTLKTSLESWATRVQSDKAVSMLQIADADGTNATPHLPINMLATHYGIPRDADYVGIIALENSSVTVIRPDGSIRGSYPISKNLSAPVNAPYTLKYTDGSTIPAGTRFECSSPCYMIYDDEGPGADRDETLMMGYTP